MTKEQQAPGELEHVRAFVNTLDIEEHVDRLGSAVALAEWLSSAGLAPSPPRASRADLAHALVLREALRAVLRAHNGGAAVPAAASEALDAAARRAGLRLRFDQRGQALLEPERGGVDGALGRLLVIVQSSIAQGTWERLKACRDQGCEWAFYDHTKNRAGAWCTMAVCGNRAKARAYRERRGSPGPG